MVQDKRRINKLILLVLVIVLLGVFVFLVVNLGIGEGDEAMQVFCPEDSRNAEFCIQVYEPVCGYFNPGWIECVREPCAETYSNSCEACKNSDVLYYVDGECE